MSACVHGAEAKGYDYEYGIIHVIDSLLDDRRQHDGGEGNDVDP